MKRVVLVRPIGPRNVGLVVRAAANFGVSEVVIAAPTRPALLLHPEFEQMAHGAPDLQERCRVVGSLTEALADATWSVGFTARVREQRRRRDWREVSGELAAPCQDPAECVALVFGSEDGGLDREESELLQELCYIPTSAEHTSINLAMAVGVVLHSLFAETDAGAAARAREGRVNPIRGDAREYLKEHLKSVLGGQVALTPAARRDIEASVERIFSRASIDHRDARAWHQILRALGSTRTPADFDLLTTPRKARRKEAVQRAKKNAPDRTS